VSFGAICPESKTIVSDVAVCVSWLVFAQQTFVPTGTVTSAGSKKLSPIATMVEPTGQPVGTQFTRSPLPRVDSPQENCVKGPSSEDRIPLVS